MLFSCGLVAAAMATSQIIANARFDYCSTVDVMIYLRYRIQSVEAPVLDPCAKETCLKRGQKVDPLEIKSGPPGGSSFGPFGVANMLKRLFQVEADLTNNSCEWKLELGRAIFCAPAFSYVLRTKKGPLLCHIVLLQFP